jgi:hypothetical protein
MNVFMDVLRLVEPDPLRSAGASVFLPSRVYWRQMPAEAAAAHEPASEPADAGADGKEKTRSWQSTQYLLKV